MITGTTAEGRRVAFIEGSFLPDGTPHPFSPKEQTAYACDQGAEAVFRLPVIAVLGGMDTQAFATLTLCDRLGFVQRLEVPVHTQNLFLLEEVALLFFKEPMAFQQEIRAFLSAGSHIAEARAQAAEQRLPGAYALLTDPLDRYGVELRVAALRRFSMVRLQFTSVHTEVPTLSPERYDAALAKEVSRFLLAHESAELRSIAQMTPSCPYQVAEALAEHRETWAAKESFLELAESLATGKLAPEQVRRGLLMLLLGIRLPNLSIAGLEAFCPYVRVENAEGDRWEKEEAWRTAQMALLHQAGVHAISPELKALVGTLPDESRMRLAGFDAAADALREKILS